MKVSVEMMKEIAEELQGTCDSLDDKLEERGVNIGSVPATLLQDLDMEVMLCSACGWWCEPCELDEEGNCNDCSEEEDV